MANIKVEVSVSSLVITDGEVLPVCCLRPPAGALPGEARPEAAVLRLLLALAGVHPGLAGLATQRIVRQQRADTVSQQADLATEPEPLLRLEEVPVLPVGEADQLRHGVCVVRGGGGEDGDGGEGEPVIGGGGGGGIGGQAGEDGESGAADGGTRHTLDNHATNQGLKQRPVRTACKIRL